MLGGLRILLRAALLVAVVALLVAAAWVLANREQARGLRQAFVVVATARDIPVASALVRRLTRSPRQATAREAAGLPALRVLPLDSRREAFPTIVLLVPDATTRGELAGIRRVQRGLSRAGVAAWTLRVPDPGFALGNQAQLERLVDALAAVCDADTTREGTIGIVAAGALASQALVAAAHVRARECVDAVLAVQPVADVQGFVRLAVTGTVRDEHGRDVPHPAAGSLRPAAGRAIVRAVRTGSSAPRPLLDRILIAAERSPDPLATLSVVPPHLLPPDLRAAVAVMSSTDPRAFDRAWRRLPQHVQQAAARLSPSSVAGRIQARVLLVVPRDEQAHPETDSRLLVRRIDDARLHRTRLLDRREAAIGFDELRASLEAVGWWMEHAGA